MPITYAMQAESVLQALEQRATQNWIFRHDVIEAFRDARDRMDRVSVRFQGPRAEYEYCRETQCLGEYSNREAALYWLESMLRRDDAHDARGFAS